MKIVTFFMVIMMLVPLPVITGCARQNENLTSTEARFYPRCQEPLEYLRNRGSATRAIAGSAATGTLISGLGSVIVGAIGGNLNAGNILANVAAGAVVGGTIGGISYAGSNREDTRQLSAYLEQIDGDISDIDNVETAGATVALQCYNKAFKDLLEQVRKRNLEKASAEERFFEINNGIRETGNYLKKEENLDEMREKFKEALNSPQR